MAAASTELDIFYIARASDARPFVEGAADEVRREALYFLIDQLLVPGRMVMGFVHNHDRTPVGLISYKEETDYDGGVTNTIKGVWGPWELMMEDFVYDKQDHIVRVKSGTLPEGSAAEEALVRWGFRRQCETWPGYPDNPHWVWIKLPGQ